MANFIVFNNCKFFMLDRIQVWIGEKMYFEFGMLFELVMMFLVILGIVFGKCYIEVSLIFGVLSFGMLIINSVDEK